MESWMAVTNTFSFSGSCAWTMHLCIERLNNLERSRRPKAPEWKHYSQKWRKCGWKCFSWTWRNMLFWYFVTHSSSAYCFPFCIFCLSITIICTLFLVLFFQHQDCSCIIVMHYGRELFSPSQSLSSVNEILVSTLQLVLLLQLIVLGVPINR